MLHARLLRGDTKLLGYVGDETPWQLGMVITSTRVASEHADAVERFLRAYRKAVAAYYDAFTSPDGKRQDRPTAPEMLAIMMKYLGQPAEQLKPAIGYIDRQAQLDVPDLRHQIAAPNRARARSVSAPPRSCRQRPPPPPAS